MLCAVRGPGPFLPESVAPNIRNRSYTLAAELEVETPEAGGVIFSQGSRFGGHALYLADGRLRYAYNWVGELVQVVEAEEPVPTGHVVVSASFERTGDSMPTEGTLSLYVRDRKVGEGRIRTQPGKFGLGGGGLVLGRRAPSRWSKAIRASGRGRSPAARSSGSSSTSAARRSRTSRPRRGRRSPGSDRFCATWLRPRGA